jgi:hypothetical protein
MREGAAGGALDPARWTGRWWIAARAHAKCFRCEIAHGAWIADEQAAKSERLKAPKERDDLFEITNLFPEDTGLPMTVWFSPRRRARHAAWVKVCRGTG